MDRMNIKNTILEKTLFSERINKINLGIAFYDNKISNDKIIELQLNKFNAVWSNSYRKIEFYAYWKEKHNLPENIKRIEELDLFPELTKEDINTNKDLIFNQFDKSQVISTGGSTGEPTRFPSAAIDFEDIYTNTYVGRSWWGIEPLEKIISLWGHSHLFGSGLKGKKNEYVRRVKDALINTVRLDAYDMRAETISDYYVKILSYRPSSIIGYTSCLYKLARFMIDNNLQGMLGRQLKVVIPTSETVTQSDIVAMKEAFRVPVAIEYGMAETGVITYSKAESNNIPVFWNSFICRKNNSENLIVTTLSEKTFPLINYNTDDCVDVKEEHHGSILALRGIKGRSKESFEIATISGEKLLISGILIVHIMKSYNFIYSVQCTQLDNHHIVIHLTSDRNINLDDACKYFSHQLSKDYNNVDPSAISIEQVDDIKRSLAGKERVSLL
jgi:phenylacetate-CoA ligase